MGSQNWSSTVVLGHFLGRSSNIRNLASRKDWGYDTLYISPNLNCKIFKYILLNIIKYKIINILKFIMIKIKLLNKYIINTFLNEK